MGEGNVLGERLRRAMESRGIGISGVVAESGLSRSTVNRMLDTGDGMIYSWSAVAEALGMELSDLVGGTPATDGAEKADKVDKWLNDVSEAAQRWRTAKAAQQSCERVVSYLEEIRDRMGGVNAEIDERMDEAIGKNRDNARALAVEVERQAELESGFYAVLPNVEPAEVAEAWRMRCMEGRTWLQCSLALHYNRTHLERLSKKAKVAVYGLIPEAYR